MLVKPFGVSLPFQVNVALSGNNEHMLSCGGYCCEIHVAVVVVIIIIGVVVLLFHHHHRCY